VFYLLLAIICSTCLLVIFKLVQRNNLEKLPVIITNYFTAAAIGAIITPGKISPGYFISQSWFPLAIMLGVLFIVVFYSVALSTALNGVAVTSVAFKLSLVIPVTAAWMLYGDKFSYMKITGIILSLAAIILTSTGEVNNSFGVKRWALVLPAFVFIGSGICDSVFNYIQNRHLDDGSISSFLTILFLTAGVAGAILLAFIIIRRKKMIQWAAVLAGFILGIPNYFSAYFMMMALEHSGFEPSALWPLNNIGTILASTATAAVFFNERMNKRGITGIILAVISILLIGFSSLPGNMKLLIWSP